MTKTLNRPVEYLTGHLATSPFKGLITVGRESNVRLEQLLSFTLQPHLLTSGQGRLLVNILFGRVLRAGLRRVFDTFALNWVVFVCRRTARFPMRGLTPTGKLPGLYVVYAETVEKVGQCSEK